MSSKRQRGASAVAATGCSFKLPAGYVKVDAQRDYKLRGVSAEGSVFALRVENNPDNGELAFWDKALQRQLVELRGYELVQRSDVTSDRGRAGVELLLGYERDGVAYTYLTTFFVKGKQLYVFESAGVKDQVADDLPEIRKTIAGWSGL